LNDVQSGFIGAGFPPDVVHELLDCYSEAARRFYLGDLRPHAVEGGRFSEATFRMLQVATGAKLTPLGKTLPKVDVLLVQLENSGHTSDSIRLHIPRTLKLIYDIRNKRDVAHLGDGIDPNLQDATLVLRAMDWVVAELVREYHGVDANRAQQIIENLVTRTVPAIEEIDGHPAILTDLSPRDQCVLILYRAGKAGATLDEIAGWLRVERKDHLRARLVKLDANKLIFFHPKTERFHITAAGIRYAEANELLKPVD
jgi:hypothetical protein